VEADLVCFKSKNILANSDNIHSYIGEDYFGREQDWLAGHNDRVHLCISRCARVTHDALDKGCPLTNMAQSRISSALLGDIFTLTYGRTKESLLFE
jgi:hypothetical protein